MKIEEGPRDAWRFEVDEPTEDEIKRLQRALAKALHITEAEVEGSRPISRFRTAWQRAWRRGRDGERD